MSAMWLCIFFAISASENKLGFVLGSNAIPQTSACICCNHKDSHAPLKPVWPVIKTRRFFQNVLFITISSTAHHPQPTISLTYFYVAAYPSAAKNHGEKRRSFVILVRDVQPVLVPKWFCHLQCNQIFLAITQKIHR